MALLLKAQSRCPTRSLILRNKPRHLDVLELAGVVPVPPGAYVAQVAEVSVGDQGAIRVHRVVAAVDCGRVVNPDGVAAQIEGGIIFVVPL